MAFPGDGFGEGPYTFLWSPTPPQGQGTGAVTGLTPGYYEVQITDVNGTSGVQGFTINALPGLMVPNGLLGPIIACVDPCGASVGLDLGIQGPYSVTSIPAGVELQPEGGSWLLDNLCGGGGYSITITDQYGCSGSYSTDEIPYVQELEIVNEVITPSCPLGQTGTMEFWFNEPAGIILVRSSGVAVPDQTVQGTYHRLVGLEPDEYRVHIWNEACSLDSISTMREVEELPTGCSSLSGIVYYDMDGDCFFSGNDVGIPGRTIAFDDGSGGFVLSAPDGSYSTQLEIGSHTIDMAIAGYDPLCPGTFPASVSLPDATPVTFNLAFSPPDGPDVQISHTASEIRPGFTTTYWVELRNNGPYLIEDLEVDFSHDGPFTFITATIPPLMITPGSLSWTIEELLPLGSMVIAVEFEVLNDLGIIGDVVTSTSGVQITSDMTPDNNVFVADEMVVSAYDPNDKRGFTSSRSSEDIYWYDTDVYVDFVVRFQNTGTAAAVNVVIVDTISPVFDPISLGLLGSSHEMMVNWRPGNVLEFAFPMIMLPDSGADESASHGYVKFRLKPSADIVVGSSLTNTADIYFDFNPPIRTNTVILDVEEPVGLMEPTKESMVFIPNPATDMVQLATPVIEAVRYEVLGLDGRVIRAARMEGSGRSFIPLVGLEPGSYRLLVFDRHGLAASGQFVKL